jgi:hypothetical protein
VSTQPTGPTAADRSVGDAAALVPTAHAAGHQPAGHVTADHVTAGHVTAREIAEFLRHLARFHSPAGGGDPADHAALLARKAELLARIADQQPHASTAAPTTPMAPEGPTP